MEDAFLASPKENGLAREASTDHRTGRHRQEATTTNYQLRYSSSRRPGCPSPRSEIKHVLLHHDGGGKTLPVTVVP